MAYLAVDKDGDEFIFGEKPIRVNKALWEYSPEAFDTNMCFLPKGSIKNLIGRELTWKDEAVEFYQVSRESITPTTENTSNIEEAIYDIKEALNYLEDVEGAPGLDDVNLELAETHLQQALEELKDL